jgi:hypothetical protein
MSDQAEMDNLALRQSIIHEIEAAFEGVCREDGVTLHEAEVLDSYGTDEERAAARKLDTDTRWQDVPDEWIEASDYVLNYAEAKGFRYYIPAYIRWTLANYYPDSSLTIGHVILTFAMRFEEDQPKFELLTNDQRTAICKFLRYVAGQPDWFEYSAAHVALSYGWGKYCDEGGA